MNRDELLRRVDAHLATTAPKLLEPHAPSTFHEP
jgi:hypothetical protein